MADFDAIERLLCQRYNVRVLDDGELSVALALAREGNEGPLRAAISQRNLYRWTGDILSALGPVAEPKPEPPSIGEMTVAELRAHAADNGIDLGDATRKADIIAAIELAGEDADED